MMLQTQVFAAGRGRVQGPTAALWHAVEVYRPLVEVDAACELAVCGSLARIDTEQSWPVVGGDACLACALLTRP